MKCTDLVVLGLCLGALSCAQGAPNVQTAEPEPLAADERAKGVWGDPEPGTTFEAGVLKHVFADGLVLLAKVGEEREEGEALVAALAEARGDGLALERSKRLPLGWTTLLVQVAEDGAVRLFEPGYGGADPAADLNASIETSLAVLGDQRHVLSLIERPGMPVDWDEEVIIVGKALEAERLYAVRVESPGSRLSGWRVAADEAASPDAEDPEVEYEQIHRLLVRRPALMQILTLPPGYMVFFEGEDLVQIVNPEDQVVWTQAG